MFSKNELTAPTTQDASRTLHFAKRGQLLNESSLASISGFEAERMRARALLTAEQEKKLLRRIDWHIMPLCALMFLMKNLDASNVCPEYLRLGFGLGEIMDILTEISRSPTSAS
jgi:hypothetical protein